VIPMSRARWWALVFTLPFVLTFNHAFMDWVAPQVGHPNGFYIGTPPPSYAQYEAAKEQRQLVVGGARVLAIAAIIVALTSFARAKTVVVVDRGARVLRVRAPSGVWDVAFGERPTLVERDGACFLHAGSLGPLAIARRGAPRAPLDRLRAALAAL